MANPANDLVLLAMQADPNVTGGSILAADYPVQPNWFVYTRVDNIKVRLDTANGNPPTQAAIDAVMNSDASQAAHDERVKEAQKNQTVQLFLEDDSPTARCTRAIAKTMLDWVNELRMVRLIGFAVATQNLPSIAAGAGLTSPNITVAGAVVGDGVFVSPTITTQGLLIYAYVSAPNTVNIRVQNGTNAAIDLPSGDWGVGVFRPRSLAYTMADLNAAVTAHVESEV